MIKINLLPAYILERRQVRRMLQMFVALAVVLVLAIVGVTYVLAQNRQQVLNDLETNYRASADEAHRLYEDTNKLNADRESRIDIFTKFYDQILDHNRQFAKTLETINRYTYKAVVWEEITLENDQFTLKGRVDSNESLAKFYENLRRCPALVPDSVLVEKVPTYPIGLSAGGGGTSSPYGGTAMETPPSPSGMIPSTPGAPSAVAMGTEPLPQYRVTVHHRPEYEFSVKATLTPDYAVAPPPSPLGGASTGTTGAGVYPGVTGTTPPPSPPPSGASAPLSFKKRTESELSQP